jgi:hypothetical protein
MYVRPNHARCRNAGDSHRRENLKFHKYFIVTEQGIRKLLAWKPHAQECVKCEAGGEWIYKDSCDVCSCHSILRVGK